MALKKVAIFNSSTNGLETPHVGDTVSVTEPVTLGKDLTVSGVTSLNGSANITGTLSLNGSAVGNIDFGTITSSAALTINDISKNWANNVYQVGVIVSYKSGGIDSAASIASNSANQLILVAGAPLPDVGSAYSLFSIGSGDMATAVYDPTGILADSFSRANHTGTQLLSTIANAGTAASKNIPAAGNAAGTEVVLGSDTRLTSSMTKAVYDPNNLITDVFLYAQTQAMAMAIALG